MSPQTPEVPEKLGKSDAPMIEVEADWRTKLPVLA